MLVNSDFPVHKAVAHLDAQVGAKDTVAQKFLAYESSLYSTNAKAGCHKHLRRFSPTTIKSSLHHHGPGRALRAEKGAFLCSTGG